MSAIIDQAASRSVQSLIKQRTGLCDYYPSSQQVRAMIPLACLTCKLQVASCNAVFYSGSRLDLSPLHPTHVGRGLAGNINKPDYV